MNKTKLVAAAVGALFLGATLLFTGPGASASPLPKGSICHYTSSDTNPVVIIDISGNAIPKHLALHGGEGNDFVIDETPGSGFTSADCPREAGTVSGSFTSDAVTATLTATKGPAVSSPPQTVSSSNGSYTFNGVLPGTYTLQLNGDCNATLTVSLTSGQNVVVPDPGCPD